MWRISILAAMVLCAFSAAAAAPDVPSLGANDTALLVLYAEPAPGVPPEPVSWQVIALYLPLDVEVVEPGCGAGYWKKHTESWPPTGYSPSQTVESVFYRAADYAPLRFDTLLEALHANGGHSLDGAVQILLRSAVTALLNAAHPAVVYPRTVSQVVLDVNAALHSYDRDAMLLLASALEADQVGCPLN